jgi:hypothetical protein
MVGGLLSESRLAAESKKFIDEDAEIDSAIIYQILAWISSRLTLRFSENYFGLNP